MEELKTLKDLPSADLDKIRMMNTNIARLLWPSEIKAEAVKDYKKWEKHPNGQNVCVYIKWKNNITDEDLK